MKTTTILITLPLLILAPNVNAAPMTSASCQIQPTVFPSGGSVSMSARFSNSYTLGQPLGTDTSTSESYSLWIGFWHQLTDLAMLGDLNGAWL